MADFKCVVCKHHYTPSDSPPCDNCEYIGDGRYSAYSPCTNADRIRHCSDEELAEWFYFSSLGFHYNQEEMLNWLKQEATDEHP